MDEDWLIDQYGIERRHDEFGNNIDSSEVKLLDNEIEEEVSHALIPGFMSNPKLVRNIALVGSFLHGKTTFVNLLLKQGFCRHLPYTSKTHPKNNKCRLVSLQLEDSHSNYYLCNLMDTPGHVEFSDEVSAALRLVDGAVLIVDAVNGVMLNTVRSIQHAIQERIPFVLVINKVDKLIKLELTRTDLYIKIKEIVDAVNQIIVSVDEEARVMDPTSGNVCFASAKHGWSFTLNSFARFYVDHHKVVRNVNQFASELWDERAFADYVLEPLYKVYGMGKKTVDSDLGSATGFADMLINHIPSPKDAATRKVEHIYTGPKEDSTIHKAMVDCDSRGPLMVNVTKLYCACDGDMTCFNALGRVYSGEIITGQKVRVLGERYGNVDVDDDEDVSETEVTKLWLWLACCMIPIKKAPAGSLVLIRVDDVIEKTATLCNLECDEKVYIFRPLNFIALPIVKTAFSLVNGDWRTSCMLEVVKKISKTYPLATVNIDKSGVCTISGTGDMYLEDIKKDIPKTEEVEMADPIVSLMEPVYYVEIQTPPRYLEAVRHLLAAKRCTFIGEVTRYDTIVVKVYLPVTESLHLDSELSKETQGESVCQKVFHHWDPIL